MDPVKLPVLFESEVAFRVLANQNLCEGIPSRVVAVYLYVRLWMECALDARSTDRPGFLSDASAQLFAQRAVEDGLPPGDWIGRLLQAGVLKRAVGGYDHPGFNLGSMNAHTAGTWVKNEVKAAYHSAFNRQAKDIEANAGFLSLTLKDYLLPDGEKLPQARKKAACNLIASIDNALKEPPRGVPSSYWPDALVLLADEVQRKYAASMLAVCHYILDHRQDTNMPKSTEAMLLNFKSVIAVMLAANTKGARTPEAATLTLTPA